MDFLWDGEITSADDDEEEYMKTEDEDRHHYSKMDNFLGEADLVNFPYNLSAADLNGSGPSLVLGGANMSLVDASQGDNFFATYYSSPRFWTETVLASLAALCNISILLAVNNAKGRRSVYNTLFVNLAIANILSCVLSWLFNNLLHLFSKEMMRMLAAGTQMCTIFVYLTAAVFVSNAFGLVSTLTMLGFATVQYFAVCRPLHHLAIVRRRRVRVFIGIAWGTSLLGGCLPWAILLGVSSQVSCSEYIINLIMRVVILGSNSCIGVLSAIYLVIISLCVRIYIEIRQVHRCIKRYRQERDLKGERRAFITIVILLTTLTTFFIPYTIVYVVSLNTEGGMGMQKGALIYYMTLLPYCKFLSDPLIYGLRMREVRDGCLQIVLRCGLRACVKQDSKPMLTSQTRSTSFTLTRMNSTFSTRRDSASVL